MNGPSIANMIANQFHNLKNIGSMSNPIMVKLLEHASVCHDEQCSQHGIECKKMKQLINHTTLCSLVRCEICKDMNEIIFSHSQNCNSDSCPVIRCVELRESTKDAHDMLKSYSCEKSPLVEVKVCCESTSKDPDSSSTQQTHLKARAVYKCGQCGMPKIRPHKCSFDAGSFGCDASLVSPFLPQQTSNLQLQNPFWSAKPQLGLSLLVSEDHSMPSRTLSNRGRAGIGVVTPRDLPLFPTHKPEAEQQTHEDVVMLPASNHTDYQCKPLEVNHDIIFRHNKATRLKQKRGHLLSRQMMKAATKNNNRIFSYANQSDSDTSSATTSTTGWSETVLLNHSARRQERIPLCKRGRADSDPYLTSCYDSSSVNMNDPYGIRKQLRQIRRQISESNAYQQAVGGSSNNSLNPSTEEEASSDDLSSESDHSYYRQYAPYESNSLNTSYVSESRSDEEQAYCTHSQHSIDNVTNTDHFSMMDCLPSETEQLARPIAAEQLVFMSHASLPCETTVVASSPRKAQPQLQQVMSASPIVLVAKPASKQRRLSQVFAAERDAHQSPSPVWTATSPDICAAFRGHSVNDEGDSSSEVDDEEDEEVFKYLNEDIGSWM